MNPHCPKCNRTMKAKGYTRKFWVCPNKSKLHGLVRFLRGAEVIRNRGEST